MPDGLFLFHYYTLTGSSSSLAAPTTLTTHQETKPPTSTSLPCTPLNTPASTPVPQLNSGGSLNNLGCENSNNGRTIGGGVSGSGVANNQSNQNQLPMIQSNLPNVEHFGSFLGEDIVNSWRRSFSDLPPLPPSSALSPSMPPASSSSPLVSTLAPSMQMRLMNHHLQQQQQLNNHHHQLNHHLNTSLHMNNHHQRLNTHSPSTDGMHNSQHDIDKTSSHHDTSSRASTPLLDTTPRGISSSIEDNLHLNGLNINSMPLPMTKSPAEDNNNSLGSLTHPNSGGAGNLIPGLPFQFQERAHFRFADDLQMPPGSMVGRLGDSLIPKGDPMEARLQEMLRYNMDKYSNKSLDTLHISRRVRELLSVHNIGQRLFAKYVLGLSQGTVSELLSKPKPWDKLTEKGRDSYRKMHAWACDDNAVMLLKSLIPKKGKSHHNTNNFSQYNLKKFSILVNLDIFYSTYNLLDVGFKK